MPDSELFKIRELSLVSASWELEAVVNNPTSVKIEIVYSAGSNEPEDKPGEAYGLSETKISFHEIENGEFIGEIKMKHIARYKISFVVVKSDVPKDDMLDLIKDSITLLAGAIRMDAMEIMKRAGARTPFILSPQEIDHKMMSFGEFGLTPTRKNDQPEKGSKNKRARKSVASTAG